MPDIFISYRRADSAGIAGRIDDQLVARFGRARVFKDVDSIPPGVNFETYIEASIRGCAVVLVVIGPRWLNASAGAFRSRRLDDPGDFVRIEIETALRLGVTIIPLLVENASMPPAVRLPASLRPLAMLNALPVRNDPDFHRDMERVTAAVARVMSQPRQEGLTPQSPLPAGQGGDGAQPAQAGGPREERGFFAAVRPLDAGLPAGGVPSAGGIPSVRPAPAQTASPPIKTASPAKRRARGPLITAVSAIALLAIAFALLASYGDLFGAHMLTGPEATATAQARARAATATASAQTARLSQLYAPNGAGPCDTNPADLPYARSGAFWSWNTTQTGKITCPIGVTELSGQTTLSFYGLLDHGHPTFPKRFTLRALLTMTNFTADMCANLALDVSGTLNGVSICRNGDWQPLFDYTAHGGHIPSAFQYELDVTVTPATASFAINSDFALTTVSITPPISAFRIDMNSQGTNAKLDISHFSIAPTS